MNKVNFYQKIRSQSLGLVIVALVCSFQLLDADLFAQVNRKKRSHSYSSLGMREARIRHGIAFNVGGSLSANLKQPLSLVPSVGIGYCAAQYYGVGNRFMQQSAVYQLGIGVMGPSGSYLVHNIIGTFHCSYIGTADLNPFIYGVAVHFAWYGGDAHFTRSFSNLYLRPEVGLAFPFKYKKRSEEVQRVTGSLTYGFNIKLNNVFNDANPACIKGSNGEVYLPWTAMFHHVVTLRLNINLKNMREMRK
jgi:hypothetical protein